MLEISEHRCNGINVRSVTGNATLRQVAEAWYQGQTPPSSAPVFLSPASAAIIGVIGAPIYFLAGMSWELIISGDDADFEDDTKDDNRFVTRALRNAATWPLFSLVLGVTVAAMILRFRDPAISVWYSAMCAWTGVLVLIVPLVLFDELKRFLVLEALNTACVFVAERFAAHVWKGYDLWDVAAGNIVL